MPPPRLRAAVVADMRGTALLDSVACCRRLRYATMFTRYAALMPPFCLRRAYAAAERHGGDAELRARALCYVVTSV